MASYCGCYVADGKSMTVSMGCLESCPCQHGVIIDGVSKTMYAPEIYKHMLKSGKKVHPHFLYLQFWVNPDGSDINPVDFKAYGKWCRSGVEQRELDEYEKAAEADKAKLQ